MKILILTTHLNPGGISRYILNLAKGLKKMGHCVWIACAQGEWLKILEKEKIDYKLIPIKTKAILSPKIILSFFSLLLFIRRQKFDLLHANTRVTQCLGHLVYKALGTPYISSFHGFHRPTIFRRLFKLRGLRTIAVSEAVKAHLVEDFGIEEERIRIVHNGIDKSDFSFSSLKQKSDYGFKESDFLIGLLGRISEEKGHFLAVEAVKILLPRYPNLYLLFLDRGRMRKILESFLRRMNLEERVKFLDLEAPQFLDIIDLLIAPSKKEGFGYSILEAFAKKIPVIGFNTGGIAEIIRDRENGLLFYKYDSSSLAKTIEEILVNKELKDKIIEGANLTLPLFSLEAMAQKTKEIYEEVLAG